MLYYCISVLLVAIVFLIKYRRDSVRMNSALEKIKACQEEDRKWEDMPINELKTHIDKILEDGEFINIQFNENKNMPVKYRFAESLDDFFNTYSRVTIGGYESIGIDSFKIDNEYLVVGGDPSVIEYAIKENDDTVYFRMTDCESVSDRVFAPMYKTIYHWLICTYHEYKERIQ